MHFKMIDQIRMVQKHGICLSHELTERDIEKRKTICELFIAKTKMKKISPSNCNWWRKVDNPKRPKAWVRPCDIGLSNP